MLGNVLSSALAKVLRSDHIVHIKRGYSAWVNYVISFWNFITIQYALFVLTIPFLAELFPNIFVFSVVSGSSIVVVLKIMGWWDFKRGAVLTESKMAAESNPMVWDTIQAQILQNEAFIAHCLGQNNIALEKLGDSNRLLHKWKKKHK